MHHTPIYLSTTGDITCDLATIVNVTECGIVTLAGSLSGKFFTKTQRIFLCSDICALSFVESTQLPVLCELFTNAKGKLMNNIYNIVWVKVVRPSISSVRLYICNEKGEILSLEKGRVNCALLILQNKV